MAKPNGTEAGSLLASIFAFFAALTLTDIGIIIGILTALITCYLNYWFKKLESQRAVREHEARMRILERAIYDKRAAQRVLGEP